MSQRCQYRSFGSRRPRADIPRVYVLQCHHRRTEGGPHATPTTGSSCGCTSPDRVWHACGPSPLRRSQAECCRSFGAGASGCRRAVQSHGGRCGCTWPRNASSMFASVFAESPTGKFSLTSTAELLRSDVPGSYRAGVLFSAGEVRWRCWSDLLGTVRTGGGGAERTLGMSIFDFYALPPKESETPKQGMGAISAKQVSGIVSSFYFPQARGLIDCGGGTGELM